MKFARTLIAALMLGDISFIGTNIAWLEGLLTNQQMPDQQFYRYLHTYHQAVQTQLNEPGNVIQAWLAQLTRAESTQKQS